MDPAEAEIDLAEVEGRLGYRFRDRGLLALALTHRSHAHEGDGSGDHYERLEFLGDATLGFVVSERLYREDGEAAEGVLSRRRQSVVRTSTLASAARDLGLGQALRLGRGELRTGGRRKASLLADVFEAVLGAVFLDGGIRQARAFVRRSLRAPIERAGRESRSRDDHKTALQELVQGRLRLTPRYRIVATKGPDHALEFEVEVLIDDEVYGRGEGANRKRAEQAAARNALSRFRASEDRS